MAVAFRVLGPLEVTADVGLIQLGGPKQRAVLALLLVDHGHVVSVDRIMQALWGEDAPEGSRNIVQVYVSNLRRLLEPVAAEMGTSSIIETRRPGYIVHLPPDILDLSIFERLSAAARGALTTGDFRTASAQLMDAVSLWRGPSLADLVGEDALNNVVARLEATRLTASTDLIEIQISLGRHAEVLEEARALVKVNPLDERLRSLLMLCLYRAGRQADALATYQEGRRLLVDELGIDPGPALRDLEAMILRQAPELQPRPQGEKPQDLSTVLGSSVLVPRGALFLHEHRVPLTGSLTTLGRQADRTIVVEDQKASREHAEIRVSSGKYVLADSGSTNGTKLNGQKIDGPTILESGDEIMIGGTTLRFESD